MNWDNWDIFSPIKTMKEEGYWPVPWTSGMGLVKEIAKLGDNVVGCEIGANVGINIIYFLDNLPNIKKIIAIDPYAVYDDRITGGEIVSQEISDKVRESFLVNIESYKDRVEFIHDTSDNSHSKIPDNSLDYIFIDGDHNYDAVLKDMKNYYSKVKDNGIFAGHDIQSQGVQQAIRQFAEEYKIDLSTVKVCDHQAWYWIKNQAKSEEYITFSTT